MTTLVACVRVYPSPDGAERGLLWETAGVVIEVEKPGWGGGEFDDCDVEFVVETGVGDNKAEDHVGVVRGCLDGALFVAREEE